MNETFLHIGLGNGPTVRQVLNAATYCSGEVITALVFTMSMLFIFTFIIGCLCGICFVKKCKNPGANESQPQYPMPVYEDVLLTDINMQHNLTIELEQNIAYGPINNIASTSMHNP